MPYPQSRAPAKKLTHQAAPDALMMKATIPPPSWPAITAAQLRLLPAAPAGADKARREAIAASFSALDMVSLRERVEAERMRPPVRPRNMISVATTMLRTLRE